MVYLVPFFIGMLFLPFLLKVGRSLRIYTCVHECQVQVYTLFGKVIGNIETPGLQFPMAHFGLKSLLIPFFGKCEIVSTALRQRYMRTQMVNSEEGTPMGIGIWYEMQVQDPVA